MEVRKWDEAGVAGGTSIARTCIAGEQLCTDWLDLQHVRYSKQTWSLDGRLAELACRVAAVPPGYPRLQLDAMDDGIWGADGFDM